VNNKEENSSDFCLDFVQEFGLRTAKHLPSSTHCTQGYTLHILPELKGCLLLFLNPLAEASHPVVVRYV